MTPEIIWDYGKKMKVLRDGDEFSIPNENRFGILVQEENLSVFRETFKNFEIEEIRKYDLNPKGKESRSHKTRLYRDLFIVSKD